MVVRSCERIITHDKLTEKVRVKSSLYENMGIFKEKLGWQPILFYRGLFIIFTCSHFDLIIFS